MKKIILILLAIVLTLPAFAQVGRYKNIRVWYPGYSLKLDTATGELSAVHYDKEQDKTLEEVISKKLSHNHRQIGRYEFRRTNHIGTYQIFDTTGQEIRLIEDVEFVSPTNLIIMYDAEVGKEALMQAVKDYVAELLYDYSIIPGIAIKIPEGKHILEAIDYFNQVQGVTAVERDHIYHLTDPVKPRLDVM